MNTASFRGSDRHQRPVTPGLIDAGDEEAFAASSGAAAPVDPARAPQPSSRRWVSLSLPRRWASDVVHFGRRNYVTGGTQLINVSRARAARAAAARRPSWTALVTKAIGLAALSHPELRRAYIPFPVAHLYEHPCSIPTIVLERRFEDELAVFFHPVTAPETQSLARLDADIRAMRADPVVNFGAFRRLIRVSRLPLLIRRALWALGLYVSGDLRARFFGTVAVNSLPGATVQVTYAPTPISFLFYHGGVDSAGNMQLTAFFDHRVVDGANVRRIVLTISTMLNGPIADELHQLAQAASEAPAEKPAA